MRTLAAVIAAALLVSAPAVAQKQKKKAATSKSATTTSSSSSSSSSKAADGTPTLKFMRPPQVGLVSGDVYAVPNVDDEVFLYNHRFFLRQKSGKWFYAGNLQGYWYDLDDDRVPEPLKKVPLGKYRKWKAKGVKLEPADLDQPNLGALPMHGRPKDRGDK